MRNFVSDVYLFDQPGNGGEIIVSGWSIPEHNHTWSNGYCASICIKSPSAPYGYFIELDWIPALRLPFVSRQIINIEFNGRDKKSFSVDKGGLFAFFCSPPGPAEPRTHINFTFPNAFKPSDYGHSADRRVLAICLRRMRLIILREPLQSEGNRSFKSRISALDPKEMIVKAEALTKCSTQEMLKCFEMLAGNCDMGLALRELDFEAMSFLRFGGATAVTAVKGLDCEFQGVGDKISTSIASNPMKEWMIKDEFGLYFHSGQSSDVVDQSIILNKFPKYVQFLRRKFLEDLHNGSKIFVFADHKDQANGRALEEIWPLYLALRRQSNAPLLWVRPAPNSIEEKGAVREILSDLAIGQLDVVAPPLLIGGGITVSGWLTVLCNAWQLFMAGAGESPGHTISQQNEASHTTGFG